VGAIDRSQDSFVKVRAGPGDAQAGIAGGVDIFIYSASLFGQNFTWKLTDAPQNGEWTSIASSADGTRLAAVCPNLGIYVSTNSGAHWLQTKTGQNWSCVASSSDGMTMFAGNQSGGIYISTNSGITWTPTGATNAYWDAIASSSNGMNLLTVNSAC
jgi:hypothetical protein